MAASKPANVDAYMSCLPQEHVPWLMQLRHTIQQTAPDAEEGLFWNMPGYRWNGPLVYFAAYKHHAGFYPGPDAITAFAVELSAFQTSKGAIQFPNGCELPLDLIARMVQYRMQKNLEKQAGKKKNNL